MDSGVSANSRPGPTLGPAPRIGPRAVLQALVELRDLEPRASRAYAALNLAIAALSQHPALSRSGTASPATEGS